MSLIPYPGHIKPSRVTATLNRSDEMFVSPVTGVQQTASRGNAYWRHTIEYRDISQSEREIVQAFLVNCRGSLNSFKLPDFGEYEVRGSVSDWIDIFSGYGSFREDGGSNETNVNSWFRGTVTFDKHINEDRTLRLEWRQPNSTLSMAWRGHGIGVSEGEVNSFAAGKAYAQRIKQFQHPDRVVQDISMNVGSGGGYIIMSSTRVESTDSVTVPFITGGITSNHRCYIVNWATAVGQIGDAWEHADYRLMRCALVSNSENLLTRSNNFAHADWTATNAAVNSGYSDYSPAGVASGSWAFIVNSNASGQEHYLDQTVTIPQTEDIYTASVRVQPNDYHQIRLEMSDGTADSAVATFNVGSKTAGVATQVNSYYRPYAKIWDVGSDFMRCQLTAVVSSRGSLIARVYLVDSSGVATFTGNGSHSIIIEGFQVRRFPFMGEYTPTVATAIIGSSTQQTGSKLQLEGFDAEDIIKAGQRIEIVTQYNDFNVNDYELTEFKRITKEAKASRDGCATIEFDPPLRNALKTSRSWKQQQHVGETLHNAVLFANPEIKSRLLGATVQYIEKPLQLTDVVFEVIEDLTE